MRIDGLLGVTPIAIGDLILVEVVQTFRQEKAVATARQLFRFAPLSMLGAAVDAWRPHCLEGCRELPGTGPPRRHSGETKASGVVVRSPWPFQALPCRNRPRLPALPQGQRTAGSSARLSPAATLLARPGSTWPPQALGGLILGLIACSAPMTTSPSPAAPSHSPINGASPASLPRHMGATLNWLRDPGSAQRMQHYEQRRMQHEQRMKQSSCRRSRPEAMARERQRESLERLDQAALLAARVQLDPTALNRERLRTFLALRGQGALGRPHPWSFSASPISASPTSRTFRPLLGSESAPHSSSPTHEGGGRC